MNSRIFEAVKRQGWEICNDPAPEGFKPELTIRGKGKTCYILDRNKEAKSTLDAFKALGEQEDKVLILVSDSVLDIYVMGAECMLTPAMPDPKTLDSWMQFMKEEKE